jgi:hypothetical protein
MKQTTEEILKDIHESHRTQVERNHQHCYHQIQKLPTEDSYITLD